MNALVDAIVDSTTRTLTENGAVTYSASLDAVVDMFFIIGAKRGNSYAEIVQVIEPAFRQDSELAFRVALWARDIRGGAGERQTFRHILKWMSLHRPDLAKRAILATLELGRADDLFTILESNNPHLAIDVIEAISDQLIGKQNGLVAKWIPRKGLINARIRNFMNLSARQFRKLLVSLTTVVETKMCAKQWDQINYSHVPSVAMSRYQKAFTRNDQDNFSAYLNRVKTGVKNPNTGKEEKINTGAVYPYDVTKIAYTEAGQVMWDNLPDYVGNVSFLPIIDTSGSMESIITGNLSCLDVATSLGVYLAQHNKSAFNDLWLNFSTNPQFQKLKGNNIGEILNNLDRVNWSGSTNLEAAMRLIVNTARQSRVAPEDMPDFLLVLSDMEFNEWGSKSPGDEIKQLFENYGYKMPNIIWWNIQSRNNIVPVRANEQGMALVSGFSPTIMTNILGGEITPLKMMLDTIMKDRYNW